MRKFTTSVLATVSALTLGAAAYAAGSEANDEAGRIEVGLLECDLIAEDNNIVVSDQTYVCTFDPAESGYSDETYHAHFSKVGVDLSNTEESSIAWAVFAPAEKFKTGVLEGEYGGVSADAALGVGVGAKALLGGFEDSIALQPVSVSGEKGVGVSLAVESLSLEFGGDVPANDES